MKSSYEIFNVVKEATYTFYMLDEGTWKDTKLCLNDKNEANKKFKELIDKAKTDSLLKIGHVLRGWL